MAAAAGKKGAKPKKRSSEEQLEKKVAKLSLSTARHLVNKDWNPAKTFVIIMALGLSDWEDEDDPDWDRSCILWDFFLKAGVPEDNMLWLDDEESTETHDEELVDFVADTEEGSVLFFYYAGHGDQDDEGEMTFCHPDDDGVTCSRLLEIIEEEFWGSHVILAIDCCFSGCVARDIREIDSHIAYGALTSATEDILSTGNWTFTDCLLCALRGDNNVDLDGDGSITFAEVATHVVRQMQEVDEQPADWTTTSNFNPEIRIAICSSLKGKKPQKKDKKQKKKDKKDKKGKKDKKQKSKKSKKDDDDY